MQTFKTKLKKNRQKSHGRKSAGDEKRFNKPFSR